VVEPRSPDRPRLAEVQALVGDGGAAHRQAALVGHQHGLGRHAQPCDQRTSPWIAFRRAGSFNGSSNERPSNS
jgi:hypothetical protein